MDTQPYKIWPEVPVVFNECTTIEEQLKHRIRRAVEKIFDYSLQGSDTESAEIIWDKLIAVPAIARLLLGDHK